MKLWRLKGEQMRCYIVSRFGVSGVKATKNFQGFTPIKEVLVYTSRINVGGCPHIELIICPTWKTAIDPVRT